MKRNILFRLTAVTAVVLSLLFSGCSKNKIDEEGKTTSPEKYLTLTNAGLKSLIQIDSFDASNSTYTFYSSYGSEVHIDGTCLRKNGNPVTGIVHLEFYEAYERKAMLIANKAVMGGNANGELEPLKTGGQYYINITQDGIPLTTTCNIQIESLSSLTGGFDNEMVGWIGYFDGNDLLWEQDSTVTVSTSRKENGYLVDIPGFGWFNCDKLYSDPRPKTDLNITIPAMYANASTVYAMIKGEPHSLGLATYGKWPIGIELHLIFVSEQNGQYQWEVKDITVQNNHSINFNLSGANTGTQTQLVTFIDTLD
ncbi:MAG TPA: hypothetical protein VLZ83_03150 [Edaphocola sp.]|nr:hypothetical protein [Edaphocola sp.]